VEEASVPGFVPPLQGWWVSWGALPRATSRPLGGTCPGLACFAPLGLRAPNQPVEATATRPLALMAGPGDGSEVCGRRASPRSPEPGAAPPMSRASSDPTAGQTTTGSWQFSPYPCDPCDPWFISGSFLDHGLHGFHGWARPRGCGPGRANKSAQPTPGGHHDSKRRPFARRGWLR